MMNRRINTAPTISVIMSIYSEPIEWIAQAVDSILNQTFTDFEFIIVNDNPQRTENMEILFEYTTKDKRIRILCNEVNLGLTKSLNRALAVVKGKFIARMDADDWSFPKRFEMQLQYFREHPQHMACGALAYVWDGKKIDGKIYRPTTFRDILYYSCTSSPFIHPLLMLNKKYLDLYGISYDENFRYAQDYKLAIDLLKCGRVGNINEYLLKYRISKQQITLKHGNEQVEFARLIRREFINWYYSKWNFSALPFNINYQSIEDNYKNVYSTCKQVELNKVEKEEFRIMMNCIRRLLYYSLDSYSWRTLVIFLKSGDYFFTPYKVRRLLIIILKHINATIIPKLL